MTDKETIALLTEENKSLRLSLEKLKRREYLTHLVKGEYNEVDTVIRDLNKMGLVFDQESYMVIFVRVIQSNHMDGVSFSRLVDKVEELTENVFKTEFTVFFAHMEKGTAFILGIDKSFKRRPNDDMGLIPTVGRLCKELWDKAEAQLNAALCISSSRPMEGVAGLVTAYQDIIQINAYRDLLGDKRAILPYYLFETSTDAGVESVKVLQMEKRYIGYVESNDYSNARIVMRQLVEAEFSDSEFSLNMVKANIMGKLSMLAKTLERFGSTAPAGSLEDIYSLIYSFQTENLHLEQLSKLVDEVFDKIDSLISSKSDDMPLPWISRVLEYVQMNFRDKNLGVSEVAEHFGMNPTYVSRQLKSATGYSLFDLIQRTRLPHAMALIKNGVTLERAAAETGFTNVKALRRAVVKHEGLLPGKLR